MEAKDNKVPDFNSLCTMRRPLALIYPQVRHGISANGSRLSSRATSFPAVSKAIKCLLIYMRSAHVNNLVLSSCPWIGHL
eukprot:10084692-Karenia_brevis.AAC.1